MPQPRLVFYQDAEGDAPLLEWLVRLPETAQDKCRIRIERLRDMGNELRRPEAGYLRDGIYELRVRLKRVNYRMLYFFHGAAAAILSHGLVKERAVPPKEIERAIRHRKRFAANSQAHTYRGE